MTIHNIQQDLYITSRAIELENKYSEYQIAELISKELSVQVTRAVVHGRLYRRRELGTYPKYMPMPYFEKYKDYYLGATQERTKITVDHSKGVSKILVLNDLHAPFQVEEFLERALTENENSDILVISEPIDLYSATSFPKVKHVSFEHEVEELIRLYEMFSDMFPVVYVVRAGHDRRLLRKISKRIPTELLWLIDTDLITLLAKPFNNIIVSEYPWYNIGDAIFTHFDKFSSVNPMSSAPKVHDWITMWRPHFNIPEYKVLVQGHCHHSGIVNYPDKQLVETGCLQEIPPFVLSTLPKQPWVHGWVTLYQLDGKTDRNSTRVFVT